MNPDAVYKPNPALEIHLPKLVRGVGLETLIGTSRRHGIGCEAMAAQYLSDRRRSRHPSMALTQQKTTDLSSSPRRMILSHVTHQLLHMHQSTSGRPMRPPRPISQPIHPLTAITLQPLVTRIAFHPETPTQLSERHQS